MLFVENLVLYNVTGALPEPGDDFTVPIGRAQVVREGRDLTIVAHSLHRAPRADRRRPPLPARHRGRGRRPALAAAARRRDGRRVGHARRSRALVAEEGWATYGVGAEVAARISRACFDDLDAPVERVGGAEAPMPYAKPLELAALPLEDKIEAAARGLLADCGLLQECARWPKRS